MQTWAVQMRIELHRALRALVNPPHQTAEPEDRQAVLWLQSPTVRGRILGNSRLLSDFLSQSFCSSSLLVCQQFISIYSVI